MYILATIYAFITSTSYLVYYMYTYKRYFELRPKYYLGAIFVLLSVYSQFYMAISLDINIGFTALFSFITYPIGLAFIYKTNIFNILFLSFNIIVKIYIMFLFFSTLYAVKEQIAYDPLWIKNTSYFALSQGHAYLISIASLYLADVLLLKDKLNSFFQLKRNLLLLITIQIIILINVAWISFTNVLVDVAWYNNMLLITAFSFEIIYFLLRLFTANSSHYHSYKQHSDLLSKQLTHQIEHYKNYEEQVNAFAKFKHDYQKVLISITQLLSLKHYDEVDKILKDYQTELDGMTLLSKSYSNQFMLDALLNYYAKRFARIDAFFTANTYIKLGTMSELNMIKLFYNILENAFEAILKVDKTFRKIEIKSEIVEHYVKISFINSTITESINSSQRTKYDQLNRGFGTTIIKEILSEYDGFSNAFIVTDKDYNLYHLEVFLPFE